MLFRIAFNFFRNVHTAEEVQDVLLRLFESRAAIESEAHLVAWLRGEIPSFNLGFGQH